MYLNEHQKKQNVGKYLQWIVEFETKQEFEI